MLKISNEMFLYKYSYSSTINVFNELLRRSFEMMEMTVAYLTFHVTCQSTALHNPQSATSLIKLKLSNVSKSQYSTICLSVMISVLNVLN